MKFLAPIFSVVILSLMMASSFLFGDHKDCQLSAPTTSSVIETSTPTISTPTVNVPQKQGQPTKTKITEAPQTSSTPTTVNSSEPTIKSTLSPFVPPANSTFCNGTYYTACSAGQDFVCPAIGNAYCQLPLQAAKNDTSQTQVGVETKTEVSPTITITRNKFRNTDYDSISFFPIADDFTIKAFSVSSDDMRGCPSGEIDGGCKPLWSKSCEDIRSLFNEKSGKEYSYICNGLGYSNIDWNGNPNPQPFFPNSQGKIFLLSSDKIDFMEFIGVKSGVIVNITNI